MDGFSPEPQWQGKATAKVAGPTADQAWSLLGDFCSLNKWFTSLSACHILEGSNNVPGCIRYCAGSINKANPTESVGWAKERLVEYDKVNRYYTYEIIESNKGFGRYKATLRVQPDPVGCLIEWSFQSDPVKGWSEKAFLSFFESMTRGVAKRLEEEIIGAH
ncbi:Lachrymatory-factor synthase [Rhynchospora pubera]|uniref:Lachrymatory-factor synthase n=1 Tax=Rhynchospora pubera TaxID=906938 RepID=A0AAV8F282_9POAL|nr:Lachrymatory-factor synthase [Rhynchospora pubera]